MRLSAPANAPAEMHKLTRRIVEASKETRTTPLKFQQFATPSDLPEPSAWTGGAVYVASLATIAITDGTSWYPLTKGAAL